jgi:hypothetical protein
VQTKKFAEFLGHLGREFCKGLEKLDGELAAAAQAAVLQGKLKRLRFETQRLRERRAGIEADPQAETISRLTALDLSRSLPPWSSWSAASA